MESYYWPDPEAPPEEEEFEGGTDECLDACFDAHAHVMGCPHGPDYDIPFDWEPDFNAETGRERALAEYSEKYR